MNPDSLYIFTAIFIMGLATYLTRVAPFLILGKLSDNPRLSFLGKYLPPTVMVILVFYCLSSVKVKDYPHGISEILGMLSVAALHFFKRNTLLSIFGGTVIYLVLQNLIF